LVCFALGTSITLCQECRPVCVFGEDSSLPRNNRQAEKGETGPPRRSGPIGPAGPPGTAGLPGEKGSQGLKGVSGSTEGIESFAQEIYSLLNSKSFVYFQKAVSLDT